MQNGGVWGPCVLLLFSALFQQRVKIKPFRINQYRALFSKYRGILPKNGNLRHSASRATCLSFPGSAQFDVDHATQETGGGSLGVAFSFQLSTFNF
jgi:hypothetical protein